MSHHHPLEAYVGEDVGFSFVVCKLLNAFCQCPILPVLDLAQYLFSEN